MRRSRGGVCLEDAPVGTPDEEHDVPRVVREQLVPLQDGLGALPLRDVHECAHRAPHATELVPQRHAVAIQRAHRAVLVERREFLSRTSVPVAAARSTGRSPGAMLGEPSLDSITDQPGQRGCACARRVRDPDDHFGQAVHGHGGLARLTRDEHRGGNRIDEGAQLRGMRAARSRVTRKARSLARQRSTCQASPRHTRRTAARPPSGRLQ